MTLVTTYNGFEYSENGKYERRKSDVAIVGAPCDLNLTDRPGARHAPDAIRNASYFNDCELHHIAFDTVCPTELLVVDAGDLCESYGGSGGGLLRDFYKAVVKVAKNTRCVITMGGDHSVILPPVQALYEQHGPMALIHYDAHPDFWESDLETDENPWSHATPIRRILEKPWASHIYQEGIRGYGPSKKEIRWAVKQGLTMTTMYELEDLGVVNRAHQIAEEIGPNTPTYLSIDIDVLDPAYAPGTGTPEPGGMTTRELLSATRFYGQALNIVGMDVVEVNPLVDPSNLTCMAAHRLIAEMLCAKEWRKQETMKRRVTTRRR